jgi:signal transduction histidine kinase/HAMP domain-containing protein
MVYKIPLQRASTYFRKSSRDSPHNEGLTQEDALFAYITKHYCLLSGFASLLLYPQPFVMRINRRITLNTRLLAFALLLASLTIIVAAFSFLRSYVLAVKNDAQTLYVELLKAHRYSESFLRQRNMDDVREFKNATRQCTATLQHYRGEEWFANELIPSVERYSSTFGKIVERMKDRGLDENSGTEGMFRRSVHELQSFIVQLGQDRLSVPLLEARRREKDYFLRHDTAYVSNVRSSILQLLNIVAGFRLEPDVQQRVQSLSLGYLEQFDRTVRATQEIELLEQQLNGEFAAIEPVIQHIEAMKRTEAAERETQLVIITIIAVIFSITAAFWLARQISAPIIALQRASQVIADGDYSVTVKPETNDEIADLGIAFNTMTAQVRRHTEQLHASHRSLTILSAIGRELSSSLDFEKILMTLYQNVTQLVNADIFSIGIYDERQQQIEGRFCIKNGRYMPTHFTPMAHKNSLAVWCIEHRSDVFINNITTEFSRYVSAIYAPPEIFAANEFPQSLVFVPLIANEAVIGVITVQSYDLYAYAPHHLDIMRTLAASAAAALNNARAYETVQSQNDEILRQQYLLEEQAAEIQIANTRLQEHNVQLELANRDKNEFMGIAAHDLKNPLTSIQMAASMIHSYFDQMNKATILERTLAITGSAKRMNEIITNLLDINAIESGGLKLTLEDFNIAMVMRHVVKDYADRAEKKFLTLSYDAPEVVLATGDEQATIQIMDNLVSNAVKYSPRSKAIAVRVLRGEVNGDGRKRVRVEVQDQGPGLTDEDKTKLFGKFARLSAQPTGDEHSTGLGLSIVKRLAEAMQGNVWCESEVGKGATFVVELPAA